MHALCCTRTEEGKPKPEKKNKGKMEKWKEEFFLKKMSRQLPCQSPERAGVSGWLKRVYSYVFEGHLDLDLVHVGFVCVI